MLGVSNNGRYLIQHGGTPFFYLGDTAWAIFQRLNREEIDVYLKDRASKGFTAIQAVAISEFDGLVVPNTEGEVPLHKSNPNTPNDSYFRHIDFAVERAASLGMYVAMLPTWGDKVGPRLWGTGPEMFTPSNAHAYGRYLGKRYRDHPIIWVLGGDRNPTEARHFDIWRAMVDGLDSGNGGSHLMTFHPQGGSSSADFLHNEPWLDFNILQSGHGRWNTPNYEMIARDYERTPIKPCMDAEPCYEDHPVNWKPENGHFGAYDTRKAAYWALFAGACGHTYGANGVFQAWKPGTSDSFGVRRTWREALDLPGSSQMRFIRQLIEKGRFEERIPDQSLLVSDALTESDHIQACRAEDGSYALVYSASGQPFDLALRKLRGRRLVSKWYDPRTGTWTSEEIIEAAPMATFSPPSSGAHNDWVLLIESTL